MLLCDFALLLLIVLQAVSDVHDHNTSVIDCRVLKRISNMLMRAVKAAQFTADLQTFRLFAHNSVYSYLYIYHSSDYEISSQSLPCDVSKILRQRPPNMFDIICAGKQFFRSFLDKTFR